MKRLLFFTIALLVLLILVGCVRSEFSQPASEQDFLQAASDDGLTICAEQDLNWKAVPGFVSGRSYDIGLGCESYDPNKPGARVTVVRFDGNDAREAALRNFETVYRRHMGSGIAYTKGPLVIMVDGSQKSDVIAALKQAAAKAGAQK
jgi:hypothetical protein